MNWEILLRESLWFSAAFSAGMMVLVMGGMLWNREIWLRSYPPDVKAKWGPMSATARKQRKIFAVLLFALIIGTLIVVPIRLTAALGAPPNFLAILVCVVLLFQIFNLVDAFIIDWLFLYKLFPKLAVLPGTEGMAGYSDMTLWFKNLLKGIPISLAMALIGAGAIALVRWIGAML